VEALDIKHNIELLSDRLVQPGDHLTSPHLKIQDLEQISAQPAFWDDQDRAQETLQELNDLKISFRPISRLAN